MSGWVRLALALCLSALGACSCASEREVARGPAQTSSSADEAPLEPLWIDTRLPAPFAAGHVPGALNLQWDWDQLEDRIAAYVPDRHRPLLLRATDEEETNAAMALLLDQGYTNVSAPTPPPETETLEVMDTEALAHELEAHSEVVLIDVRSSLEHLTGTIEGALRVDPDEAPKLLDDLDPSARYLIICEGGYRSGQLASWLHLHGFKDVTNVIDGMWAWRRR